MTGSCTATQSNHGLDAMQADVASKLRSTCDRCTLLKVRCDKQKPRCERCKGLGSPCVYSPRRWKGRTAAKSVSSSRSTHSVEIGRAPSVASRSLAAPAIPTEPWDMMTQSAQSDSFGLHTPDLDINVEFQDTPMGMGLQWDGLLPGVHDMDADGWCPGFMDVDQGENGDATISDRSTHDHAARSRIVTPSPALTSATAFSHMGSSVDLTTSASSPDAGHSASSCTESPESSYGPAASSCQCPTLVFQLLQDMYHADPLSSYRLAALSGDNTVDGGTPEPSAHCPERPRSDDMVKVTREAVQRMEQLLSCDYAACVRDPTLFFLVTALSSKLLAWYRAVFALVRRQSSGASPEPGADEAVAAAADLAFVVPIQVEGFHLDFGSEQRMKAQFLLCEVRRLGQVLDLFGARALSRTPSAPYLAAPPGTLPIPAVHQFLITSHSRLVMDMKDYCVS